MPTYFPWFLPFSIFLQLKRNTSPLLLRKHSNSELISLLLLDVECTEKKQEAPMLQSLVRIKPKSFVFFGKSKTHKFSVFLGRVKPKSFLFFLGRVKPKSFLGFFFGKSKTHQFSVFLAKVKHNFFLFFWERVKHTSFLVFFGKTKTYKFSVFLARVKPTSFLTRVKPTHFLDCQKIGSLYYIRSLLFVGRLLYVVVNYIALGV